MDIRTKRLMNDIITDKLKAMLDLLDAAEIPTNNSHYHIIEYVMTTMDHAHSAAIANAIKSVQFAADKELEDIHLKLQQLEDNQ